jgi:hypothetical protein
VGERGLGRFLRFEWCDRDEDLKVWLEMEMAVCWKNTMFILLSLSGLGECSGPFPCPTVSGVMELGVRGGGTGRIPCSFCFHSQVSVTMMVRLPSVFLRTRASVLSEGSLRAGDTIADSPPTVLSHCRLPTSFSSLLPS